MNIDKKYMVDFMLDILSIPSPGGDTKAGIERTLKEFQAFGVDVRYTNKGAIIGTIKGEDDENQRVISAHIDTLGAVVKDIKPNGRLKLTTVGGFAWNSVEGEEVTIRTISGKEYTGNVLPIKASIHCFSDEVSLLQRNEDTVEVRIDENVSSKEDTLKLGIRVGDFAYFNPRPIVTESGYLKSRYLDDKACVANLFAAIKYLKDNNIKPKHTTHFYISNYEEMGHGISYVPEKTTEFLALDIGTVGEGHTSDEFSVTIVAKDSRTPYDFEFKKKLVELAESCGIKYNVDVHYRYGSDASLSVVQGFDFNFACIGPGVDATHHYERTHMDGMENTTKLIIKYITE